VRPLVVLDTSVFVADAYSRSRRGGASTVLALAAVGAIDVVLCEEIRAELREVFEEDANRTTNSERAEIGGTAMRS